MVQRLQPTEGGGYTAAERILHPAAPVVDVDPYEELALAVLISGVRVVADHSAPPSEQLTAESFLLDDTGVFHRVCGISREAMVNLLNALHHEEPTPKDVPHYVPRRDRVKGSEK